LAVLVIKPSMLARPAVVPFTTEVKKGMAELKLFGQPSQP